MEHTINGTHQTLEVTNGTWPSFTTSEVIEVLSNLYPLKAAGPDKIHPRLRRQLDPKADSFLQQLFNQSIDATSIPHDWQVADIRPVPKQHPSNHPISLISTIGKVMERLVTIRIRYEVETRRLLSENQAGFLNGRSTEDQLLRLSQSISYSLQCSPMKRNVLKFIDHSRAYDRAWQEALLLKMLRKVSRHI